MQLAKYFNLRQACSIALLVLLCSCRAERSDPNTIITVLSGPPGALDPLFSSDANSQHINQLIHAALVRTGEDLRPEPELAESFRLINPTTLEFTLRPNCKFQNGRAVAAEDVKKSWELFTSDQYKSLFKDSLKRITAIEVLDARRLRIKMAQPTPALLGELAVMKIIPIEEYGKDFNDHPVGAGPFRVVQISQRETILEVFPQSCTGPIPSYKRLVVKTVRDDLARLLKLRTGEADIIINELATRKVARVIDGLEPTLGAAVSEGLSYNYLGVNVSDPILKNPRVRLALALSLDIPALTKYHSQDMQSHAKTILADMSFYANHELALDSRDLPRAKKILGELGYFNGQNNKPPLQLQLLTGNNAFSTENARILINQARDAGIDLQLKSYEFGTFMADVRAKRTQLYLLRWVGAVDPGIYAEVFASDGKGNRTNYKNPQLDTLFAVAEREMNAEKRRVLYNHIQSVLHEDRPYINLWHSKNHAVFRKEITNVRLPANGSWRMFLSMNKSAKP